MTTIKLKNGSGAPLAGDLVQGEPALDLTNKRLYTEDSGGTVIEVGTNPTSVTTGTLTTTGNVGIGTSSPNADLELGGAGEVLRLSGSSTNAYIRNTDGTTNQWYIGSGGNAGLQHYVYQAEPITFHTSGSERMRIDASGKTTVTGTATAGFVTPFVVKNPSTNAASSVKLEFDGGGTSWGGIGASYNTNNPYMAFFVGSGATTEAMRIDASGKVLVGKTSSAVGSAGAELQSGAGANAAIIGTASVQPLILNRLSTDGDIAQFRKNGSTVGVIQTKSNQLNVGTGDTGIQTNADVNAIIPHNTLTNVNVDNSIDLGYAAGGSNFRFKDLYLSGSARVNQVRVASALSAASPEYTFQSDSSMGMFRLPGVLAFSNGGIERMRIDSSGALLVGTTTTGLANTTGIGVNNPSGATYISVGHPNGTASGSAYMGFVYNGGTIGSVTQSGTTAVLYNTSSDQRLKENIVDAPSASDDIDAIQVRSFDWKADGSHQKYGMVAQELNTVAPEAVSAPEDPEDMMGVDYSKLVPMMLKEIQSLRARVAQLETN